MNAYKKMQILLTNNVRHAYRELTSDEKIEYITFVNLYKEYHDLKTKDHFFYEWQERYEYFEKNKNTPGISNKVLKNVVYDPKWSIEDFKIVGLENIITFSTKRGLIQNYFNGGKKRSRRKKLKRKNKSRKRMKSKKK